MAARAPATRRKRVAASATAVTVQRTIIRPSRQRLTRRLRSRRADPNLDVFARQRALSLPRFGGHRGYAASAMLRQSASVSFGLR